MACSSNTAWYRSMVRTGNHVTGSPLGLLEAARIAGHHGNAAQHALHHDQAEPFVPQRRHQQDPGAREHVVDVARIRQEPDIGQPFERPAIVRRGAPAGHDTEGARRHEAPPPEEDRDALDRAGIDHGNEPTGRRACRDRARAVNRGMNDYRRPPQRALDVLRHVPPDGDHSSGLRHQIGGSSSGFQLAGPKG